MAKRLNLRVLEALNQFDTRIDDYIDGQGYLSKMKWIPPFRAYRALTAGAAVATPSNTIGDWFHPLDLPSSLTLNTDYSVYQMGGYWVDMYLCSSPDASRSSMGTVADGGAVKNYVSQPGVAPRVNIDISFFKTYLAARFATGGFAGQNSMTGWAGKGGLITDQHWFELWIWTRINRWLLHGNTNGCNVGDHIPVYHGDASEIGVLDGAQTSTNGASITGGGPKSWEVPVSDFCGNRWEFTDGLRLYNGVVFSAGKKINPGTPYSHADYASTGYTISGITSGQSVASYYAGSTANVILHGIPASGTTAGAGPFDGQGFWVTASGEIVAVRGGYSDYGAQCPGALYVSFDPSYACWAVGARAVLVP